MFAIVRDPIDPRSLEEAVRTNACGGVVTFLGVVRERANDGEAVTGLSYEAYESMACEEFARVAAEARERFGEVNVAIVHRVGDLGIGEVAVVVAVASRHRAAAFDACEFAIDAVKARAPIWKKEHYVNGPGAWVANEC